MVSSDKRQLKTKENIYSATLKLLKGSYPDITVKRICEETGITRPTFYRYFKDITHLLNSMSEEVLNVLKESLTINKKTPLKEMQYNELPINMIKLFEHILENKYFYEAFLLITKDQYFTEQVSAIIEEYIKRGIEYGSSEEDILVPVPLLLSYSTGAYLNSIVWWMQNDYLYSPKEMTAIILRLSIKGPYKEDVASFIKD